MPKVIRVRPKEQPDRIRKSQLITLGQLGVEKLKEQIDFLHEMGFHQDDLLPSKTYNAKGPGSKLWLDFYQRGLEDHIKLRDTVYKELRKLGIKDKRKLKRVARGIFWHEITHGFVGPESVKRNLKQYFETGMRYGFSKKAVIAHIAENVGDSTLSMILSGNRRTCSSSFKFAKSRILQRYIPRGTPHLLRARIMEDPVLVRVAVNNPGAIKAAIRGAIRKHKAHLKPVHAKSKPAHRRR